MRDRLKRWEAALMAGFALGLLWTVSLDAEQTALAQRVIRLHVVANSDSEADQALKLRVRDRVLEQAAALYQPEADVQQATAQIRSGLDGLAQIGRETVAELGFDYPVTAQVKEVWFPTKKYDGFALPAGKYTALQVVIGEGKGQNWWCVLFPPLCLGSVTEQMDKAEQVGHFDSGQVSLMTGGSGQYVIRFRAMELWEQVKEKLA